MGAERSYRRRAIFLDRDGVINRNVLNPVTGEYESPLTVDDFQLIPGAIGGMRALQKAGYLLFLVSNQPNYAKGKCSLSTLKAIHKRLLCELARECIEFTRFYYCVHHPQGTVAGYSRFCKCRKPSPYFVQRACLEFSLDLSCSWMIGDRRTDMECGKAAGTKTVFIRAGEMDTHIEGNSDRVASDLFMAARLILSTE